MNVCSSRYCQYNLPGNKTPPPKLTIKCPICKMASYCSQRCRDNDWSGGHRLVCKPIMNPLLSQELPISETVSTLRQMKRTPDDFETVQSVGNSGQIGKGSFGQVKLVREKSTNQLYALKIMNKREIFDYCSVDNLKREIRIQRKLQHPNVTKLYHYFEDKENVYLVLEYAEKGSLFNYLKKRQQLTEQEAYQFFYQTCKGIQYLHHQGIIHRDLKPENLLIDADGTIKICDFGWSAENLSGHQKRSTFCGTIDYMAPEMIENKPHDFSLDLWCLGILLFELLHGRAPFQGRNDIEKCNNIVKCASIKFNLALSKEVCNLISCLLKYNPIERIEINALLKHPWMLKMDMGGQSPKVIQPSPAKLITNSDFRQLTQSTATSKISQTFRHQRSETGDASFQFYQPPLTSKNAGGNKNGGDFSFQEETRFSNRYSQRYHLQQEIQPRVQRKEQTGFFDKLLVAFGCVKREDLQKQQQQS